MVIHCSVNMLERDGGTGYSTLPYNETRSIENLVKKKGVKRKTFVIHCSINIKRIPRMKSALLLIPLLLQGWLN